MSNVKLPYCSELELCVTKNGHKFGPTIAHLLKKNSHVRKLSLKTYHKEVNLLMYIYLTPLSLIYFIKISSFIISL